MKVIKSNGKELTVRDVSPVIYRVTAGRIPIKMNGVFFVEDDKAREILEQFRNNELYVAERIDAGG